MWIHALILCQIAMVVVVSAVTDKVICYYETSSVYRPPPNGTFDIKDIDPRLCTHMIYGYMNIRSDGAITLADSWFDIDLGGLKNFQNLKNINRQLKTLVSVQGWNSTNFFHMEADPKRRRAFILKSVDILKQYGFDGLDVDWVHPGQRGDTPEDKANFAELLKEFRQILDKHGYLITAAVSATPSKVDRSYDVGVLSRYLDFINVMTYDLHGAWDGKTGENAPLYASSLDSTPASRELNVKACIQGWIDKGAEPAKIIMGMATYGRSFTLDSDSDHGLGAPTSGPGAPGPFVKEKGILGYNEVVERLAHNQLTVVWDDEQKVPYGYASNFWIGYDNPESFRLKVEFAKKMELAGVAIKSIDTDDFKGISGVKFPLLKTVKSNLNV